MLQPEDEFLKQHPDVLTAVLLVMSLLLLFALGKTWALRRDRDAYLKQAQRLAAIRPDFSLAYAQGFLALGWLAYIGFLMMFLMGLWTNLVSHSYDGTFWILEVSVACLWASVILPCFYWPRWAMPPHARGDVSPFHKHVQRRRSRRP